MCVEVAVCQCVCGGGGVEGGCVCVCQCMCVILTSKLRSAVGLGNVIKFWFYSIQGFATTHFLELRKSYTTLG